MTIVDRIFSLIQNNEITANKLTNECGLSNGTLYQWKAGKQKPSTEAIIKIARYFGVTTDYLLIGEKNCTSTVNRINTLNNSILADHKSNITIKINGNEPRPLTEIESELIRICEKIDIKKKHSLLDYAFKLEEE